MITPPQQDASLPSAPLSIYQTDAEGRCIYVNNRLCELFQISRQEAMDLGWLDRIDPLDRERVLEQRKNAISAIPTFYIEYRVKLPAKTIWVAAFSTAIVKDKVFMGRTGIISDITESKGLQRMTSGLPPTGQE